QVPRPPLRVRLEPARGEHDGVGVLDAFLALLAHPHAVHPVIVADEPDRARAVLDADAGLLTRRGERVDEPRPASHGLDGEAAPELETAVDEIGLPAVDRYEPHALVAHPEQR